MTNLRKPIHLLPETRSTIPARPVPPDLISHTSLRSTPTQLDHALSLTPVFLPGPSLLPRPTKIPYSRQSNPTPSARLGQPVSSSGSIYLPPKRRRTQTNRDKKPFRRRPRGRERGKSCHVQFASVAVGRPINFRHRRPYRLCFIIGRASEPCRRAQTRFARLPACLQPVPVARTIAGDAATQPEPNQPDAISHSRRPSQTVK